MNANEEPLSDAIEKLKNHLSDIARVAEWADLMGYDNPKYFSEKFLQHYDVRPHKVMDYIRLKSITKYLRTTEYSNHQIARIHSLPGEKALNNYTNYHLGHSPTNLKTMPEARLYSILEKFGSKIQE
jgi:methylphosphotriester-DNA--protein-cysteine methyltransferase